MHNFLYRQGLTFPSSTLAVPLSAMAWHSTFSQCLSKRRQKEDNRHMILPFTIISVFSFLFYLHFLCIWLNITNTLRDWNYLESWMKPKIEKTSAKIWKQPIWKHFVVPCVFWFMKPFLGIFRFPDCFICSVFNWVTRNSQWKCISCFCLMALYSLRLSSLLVTLDLKWVSDCLFVWFLFTILRFGSMIFYIWVFLFFGYVSFSDEFFLVFSVQAKVCDLDALMIFASDWWFIYIERIMAGEVEESFTIDFQVIVFP